MNFKELRSSSDDLFKRLNESFAQGSNQEKLAEAQLKIEVIAEKYRDIIRQIISKGGTNQSMMSVQWYFSQHAIKAFNFYCERYHDDNFKGICYKGAMAQGSLALRHLKEARAISIKIGVEKNINSIQLEHDKLTEKIQNFSRLHQDHCQKNPVTPRRLSMSVHSMFHGKSPTDESIEMCVSQKRKKASQNPNAKLSNKQHSVGTFKSDYSTLNNEPAAKKSRNGFK